MAHSKFIVIKCPACGEKFEAEREEEASFISCPECDMQVKISGTHDRKSRSPRRMSPAASIPSKRYQERVQFSDLAAGPIDMDVARKRAKERLEKEELVIDDDEEASDSESLDGEEAEASEAASASKLKSKSSSGSKSTARSGIERRAARLEERAAKLEERAAKLAKLRLERDEEPESHSEPEPESKPSREASGKGAKKKGAKSKAKGKAPPEAEAEGEGEEAEEATKGEGASVPNDEEKAVEMEKVEVRSTGERRRLKRAPKADVPEPRGRPGAPRYVDDLKAERRKEPIDESVAPKQDFDERKITEGSSWRRHNPSRVDDPDWESDEDLEEEPLYPYQKRQRLYIWGAVGLVALFLVMAGYQFILAQLGWLEGAGDVDEAPPIVFKAVEGWSKSEMLAQALPVIEYFLTSTSNEDALQYVRHPGKVARFMRRHYMPGSFQPVEVKTIGPSDECRVDDDRRFFSVPIVLEDFSEGTMILEIPQSTVSPEWLIDWESWVGYSEMRFSEMRIRKPKQPVTLRCFAIQEEFYNYEFTQKDFVSCKLFDDRREHQLWGYIRLSSEAYRQAATIFGLREQLGELRVTLKVRFPNKTDNKNNDQVEITEFESGWNVRR